MSIFGKAYQFDVFFSYAWATGPDGDKTVRDWTRMVADTISKLVRVRFGTFDRYLDRDANKYTAGALDETLQRAAESSALFVAFISPYYRSEYCQKELGWFLDRVKAQGSDLTDRMCLFPVQKVAQHQWPPRLREATGTQFLYKEFCDGEGQPLEMAEFLLGAPMPLLANPIKHAVLEIGNKLQVMKDREKAKDQFRSPRKKPVVFLEAEQKDEARWAECRRQLKVENVILPATTPTPATALEDPKATYTTCDGVVLLRSRKDDDIATRLNRSYFGLRRIEREDDRQIPWALLDEVDDPSPEGEAYEIPRVVSRGEWVPELHRIIRRES